MKRSVTHCGKNKNIPAHSHEEYRERVKSLFKTFCMGVAHFGAESDGVAEFLESMELTFDALNELLNADELRYLVDRMRDECEDILSGSPQVTELIDRFEKEVLPPVESDNSENSGVNNPENLGEKARRYFEKLKSYGYTLAQIAQETGYSFDYIRNRFSSTRQSNEMIVKFEEVYPFLTGQGEAPPLRKIDYPLDDFIMAFNGAEELHAKNLKRCFFWGIRGDQFLKLLGQFRSPNHTQFIRNLNGVLKDYGSVDDLTNRMGYSKRALTQMLSLKTGFTLIPIYKLLRHYPEIDAHRLFQGIPEISDQLPEAEKKNE